MSNKTNNKSFTVSIPEYLSRAIEEHKQLVDRINKLDSFIYKGDTNGVSKADFANMCIQLKGMRIYEEALRSRLENAGIRCNNGYCVTLKTIVDNEKL